MNIGKPLRIIIVVPNWPKLPERIPIPNWPVRQPVTIPNQPVKVQ